MHTIDLARAKGVMDMRAVMDGLAARYAALKVAQGVTAESFLTVFDAMQTAAKAGDYQRFLETDLAFHLAIVKLANIDGLPTVYKQLRKYQISFHKDTIREYWPDLNVLFEAHRQIAEAVLDGDPNAAEDCAKGPSRCDLVSTGRAQQNKHFAGRSSGSGMCVYRLPL
jgi:DNA-binding GntR family transcriptional regulator